MPLHRTNIYLTENQMKKFKDMSEKTGISIAKLIRDILDEWLKKYERVTIKKIKRG
jgi:ribosomal protein L18E